MTDLFTNILSISLEATIIAAIIIFIKKVFASKMNIRTGYLLWVLLLIRLIFPILPQSPVSIFNPIGFNATNINLISSISQRLDNILPNQGSEDTLIIPSAATTRNSPESNDQGFLRSSTADKSADITTSSTPESPAGIQSDDAYEEPVGITSMPPINKKIIEFLSYIWAAGVVLILTYYFIVNAAFAARLKRFKQIAPPPELVSKLKAITKVRRPVRFVESESVTSPCVFGAFRFTILLPKNFLDESDPLTLFNILTHEYAHIKHGDLALCWLTSLICAIHWFNPVVWYCSVLVKRDQELCADAYTMSQLEDDQVYEYGKTLLSAVAHNKNRKYALITAGITENKRTLKQRIRSIAVFTKRKYRLTLIGIGLIALAGLFLCTSQINYPKTGQQRMAFDDNVQMAIYSENQNAPQNIKLQIYNQNDITINNCELEIFNGLPNKSESNLIYSNKNFSIGANKSKDTNISGIDYHSAYIRFNYKVGFAFDNSNISSRSGDIAAFDMTNRINGWSPVTDEETQAFIKENNINAISINQLYGFYTVILYEAGDVSGYYELYKSTNTSKLSSRWVKGYGGGDSPVRMLGGTATGAYPFINIMINHPALLALGDKIEIETANGVITRYVSGTKAHCVETKGYGNVNKILIYDKSNKLIYDGNKALFGDVQFNAEDRAYANITNEKGFKILNQTTISQQINFTAGMFPDNYVVAYKSGDIDWKIPLISYENTTIYLKSIVEANESTEQLYANLYMIHDIDNKPGKILSGNYINFENNTTSYSNGVYPQRDVFSEALGTLKDTVSLRGSGPGDQMHFYLDKAMVEKTNGNFTVTLEGLNLISYTPK